MKKILLLSVLFTMAGTAHAEGIPLFNVDCPGNIAVNADPGGPVYINGKKVKTTTLGDRSFEAKGSDITISISVGDDDSVTVSYTDKHGASGVCESVDD